MKRRAHLLYFVRLCAADDPEAKRKAYENGTEAPLAKPIDFTMLRGKIELRMTADPSSTS